MVATKKAEGPRPLALNVPEALKYALQIADALAAARSEGIVHRDIKPPNIVVTADGLVRVFDFGLAKLTEQPEMSEENATRTVRILASFVPVRGSWYWH